MKIISLKVTGLKTKAGWNMLPSSLYHNGSLAILSISSFKVFKMQKKAVEKVQMACLINIGIYPCFVRFTSKLFIFHDFLVVIKRTPVGLPYDPSAICTASLILPVCRSETGKPGLLIDIAISSRLMFFIALLCMHSRYL